MATTNVPESNANTPVDSPAPPRKAALWKRILFTVAALIAVLCVFIAMQPAEFEITRAMQMAAPPDAVFNQVNDFHKWEAWSPWAKMDPNAKNTFKGPTSGEGAELHWDGNSSVGAGNMKILESKPSEHVHLQLNFIRPMEGTADTHFTFEPEGDGTNVTWTMTGTNNFIAKAINLVMDCDKMVGGEFEKGLTNIKNIVEAKPGSETPAAETPPTS